MHGRFDPVDAAIAAYNARDVEAFLACFDPHCVTEDGENKRLMAGRAEMRMRYQSLFDNSPNLHCEIIHRKRVGEYVVTEESFRGFLPGTHIKLTREVCIYRIDRVTGLIANMRFLRDPDWNTEA